MSYAPPGFEATAISSRRPEEENIEQAPEHKLPLEQAIKIGIETAQGLAFAHEQNIIHRDIKPGNVWLATDGRAQVGDWSLGWPPTARGSPRRA